LSVNIEEPAPDQKIRIFFYFTKKILFVNYFQKRYSKAPAKFRFLRKIGKLKIGLNLIEGPMEIMQIGAYSKRSYEKNRKLIYISSLQGVLHNSQSVLQAISDLDLGFFLVLTPVQRR